MANLKEIRVPDLGGKGGAVIEINVKPGDVVKAEDTLITLESEKATMELPSPQAGRVHELKVKIGDKLDTGALILLLEAEGAAAAEPAKKEMTENRPVAPNAATSTSEKTPDGFNQPVHAGPAVRRQARLAGVDLKEISGSGPKGLVLPEDLSRHVGTAPAAIKTMQSTESIPLSRIKKITGQRLHESWTRIPHVTQFDEADITELEAFRKSKTDSAKDEGVKLTFLPFLMKAVVGVLKDYPHFNASLDESGDNLIVKNYFHLGVAVDTPQGLLVPVIRDVDQKGILQLAKELATISQKAREKGLSPAEMQGGCFTISSLGGVGGTAFTPIINAPEVAILGVSKSDLKPVYQNGGWIPRLKLPLSLSYDHRVIDGVQAAKFTRRLAEVLGDMRELIL